MAYTFVASCLLIINIKISIWKYQKVAYSERPQNNTLVGSGTCLVAHSIRRPHVQAMRIRVIIHTYCFGLQVMIAYKYRKALSVALQYTCIATVLTTRGFKVSLKMYFCWPNRGPWHREWKTRGSELSVMWRSIRTINPLCIDPSIMVCMVKTSPTAHTLHHWVHAEVVYHLRVMFRVSFQMQGGHPREWNTAMSSSHALLPYIYNISTLSTMNWRILSLLN